MEDELIQALIGTTNEQPVIRQEAENFLEQCARMPGYGKALVNIFMAEQVPLHIRQLAAIILKRFIRSNWPNSPQNQSVSHDFIVISDEEKEYIKEQLPQRLSAPQGRMRMAAGMAIASIAHWEWPSKWPGLVSSLLSCLGSNDTNLVEGAICCLDLFASGGNLADDHLPGLISLAFPPLLEIVKCDDARFSDRVKMRAVDVIEACIEWLSVTKQVTNKESLLALRPMLCSWSEVLVVVLRKEHSLSPPFLGLRVSSLQLLLSIVQHFPSMIKDNIFSILSTLWSVLEMSYGSFLKNGIDEENLDEINLKDDETKNSVGWEPFLSLGLEILDTTLQKEIFRPLFNGKLVPLIYLTLGYLQFTQEQVEIYEDDPNEWIYDEQVETTTRSVRNSANHLLFNTFRSFRSDACRCLGEAVGNRLNEANQSSNANLSWKMKEAVLYGVGTVARYILSDPQSFFDLTGFSQSVLSYEMSSNVAFVRGRALWCASALSKKIPISDISPFLASASNVMNSAEEPVPIKMFAVRSVANFCPRIPNEILGSYLGGILSGLLKTLDIVKGESLFLLLSTLHVLLPMSEAATCSVCGDIIGHLFVLWSHQFRDLLLVADIRDLLQDMMGFASCQRELQERTSSSLYNLMTQSDNRPIEILEGTLDFVDVIVSGCTTELHPILRNDFFTVLLNMMLTSEDETRLQAGTSTVRAFVGYLGEKLASWHPSADTAVFSGNESGLEIVVKVIARLVREDTPDGAAKNVGALIEKMLLNNWNKFLAAGGLECNEVLNNILSTMLSRLHQNPSENLKQGLLFVFVRLILAHSVEIVQFLASKPIGGGETELHFLMREWTQQHEEFCGDFHIKLSIIGLSRVFEMCFASPPSDLSQLLSTIVVRGDLILSSGRNTRSSRRNGLGDQYSQEILPLKIFKLLVKEFQVILENEEDFSCSLSDSNEMDDDDEAADIVILGNFNGMGGVRVRNEGVVEPRSLGDSFSAQASYKYLDELLDDKHRIRGEEEEDPEIKSDPIYQIDLKEFIKHFFSTFRSSSAAQFNQFYGACGPLERQCLEDDILDS